MTAFGVKHGDVTPIPDPVIWDLDFENTTTGTRLAKGMGATGSIAGSSQVKMIGIIDRGLVLEVPEKSCSHGHNLLLKITAIHLDAPTRTFTGTVRVQKHDRLPNGGDGRARVELSLLQFPEDEWSELLRWISEVQKRLTDFLSVAKGE